ncbi:hypothetical protein [Vibrio ouci]|uniref:Uncharacterized protein n=1 Tax=Vibrio ouci TaxID=2499078 RepID=A0A4Y8W8B7_9VIBR|nr:hypothetical protein [Vibrio ouci]TFH89170.1 hypothetical protein ELS82_23695 [Vibrio ouci]
MKFNYDKVLSLIVVLSFYLMIASSPEPLWQELEGSLISKLFLFGNYGTLFTLSSGVVVSYIFYLIVVYYPSKKRKSELRDRMCNQLSLFMSWIKPIGSDLPLFLSVDDFDSLLEELVQTKQLTDLQPAMIKRLAIDNLEIFAGLIPVASEISEEHLTHWCNATQILRGIANTKDDSRDIYRFLVYFLKHIQRFKQSKI